MTTIRNQIEFWPWTCHWNWTVETVFAKLRIGNVNTEQNMDRSLITPLPVCRCGMIESVKHKMFHCPYMHSKEQFYMMGFR